MVGHPSPPSLPRPPLRVFPVGATRASPANHLSPPPRSARHPLSRTAQEGGRRCGGRPGCCPCGRAPWSAGRIPGPGRPDGSRVRDPKGQARPTPTGNGGGRQGAGARSAGNGGRTTRFCRGAACVARPPRQARKSGGRRPPSPRPGYPSPRLPGARRRLPRTVRKRGRGQSTHAGPPRQAHRTGAGA